MSSLICGFFSELHDKKIRYCHWKSIDRLEEAYRGDTDYDLLVDVKDAERFIGTLIKFGGKQVMPRSWMVFPNMEDYLVYDKTTGNIHHFHLHYKLIMGRKNLKEYLLPLEKVYLDTAVYDNAHKTYVVNPHLDLIILTLRTIQKTNIRSKLKLLLTGKKELSSDKEIKHLIKQIDKERIYQTLLDVDAELNSNGDLFNAVKTIIENEWVVSIKSFVKLEDFVKQYAIYNFAENLLFPLLRNFLNNWAALFSRNNAKHFRKSGIAVALVGADGSGKTTVSDSLITKLRYKLSAKKYYLGCNKRSYSSCAKIIVGSSYLLRAFKKVKHINLFANIHLGGVLLAEYACLYDRKNLYCKSRRDIAKGMVIIYERFPLKDTIDYPACFINHYEVKNKYHIVKKFENYMRQEYTKITEPADLTFWVNAPVDLILSRRAMDSKTLRKVEKKYKLVSSYAKKHNLLILDAHKSVEELTNDITNRIFEI